MITSSSPDLQIPPEVWCLDGFWGSKYLQPQGVWVCTLVLLMPIIPIPLITCDSRSPCSSHWNCCCSHRLHLNKGNRPSNLHQAASCQGRCPVILPKRGGSLKGHLGHRSSDSTCFSCLMFFFLLTCLFFYHNVHPLSSMFHFFLFSDPGPTVQRLPKDVANSNLLGSKFSFPSLSGHFW